MLSASGARGDGLRGLGACGRTSAGKSSQVTTVQGSYGAPTAFWSGGGCSCPNRIVFGFTFSFSSSGSDVDFTDGDVGAAEPAPPDGLGWESSRSERADGDGASLEVRGLSKRVDAPGPFRNVVVSAEQAASAPSIASVPSAAPILMIGRLLRAVVLGGRLVPGAWAMC